MVYHDDDGDDAEGWRRYPSAASLTAAARYSVGEEVRRNVLAVMGRWASDDGHAIAV